MHDSPARVRNNEWCTDNVDDKEKQGDQRIRRAAIVEMVVLEVRRTRMACGSTGQ